MIIKKKTNIKQQITILFKFIFKNEIIRIKFKKITELKAIFSEKDKFDILEFLFRPKNKLNDNKKDIIKNCKNIKINSVIFFQQKNNYYFCQLY